MSRVVFIVGPTSVGKSRCAEHFAEQTGGEIVNADAFQVYRELPLLTSAPGGEALARVPHHLFGMVPPTETYNVARYLDEATGCLAAVRSRGRSAIVVGGTGLYIKALTHGLSPLPASNAALRGELEGCALTVLIEELQRVDPAAFDQIDTKNKRRVVRALEVFRTTGTRFSSHRENWTSSAYQTSQAGVFLERDRQDLRRRIDQQVENMFAAGVVDEVRAATAEVLGPTAAGTIGLAEIQEFLAGRLSLSECKDRIKTRTAQYAKRQVTWFKKESVFRRFILRGGTDELPKEVHEYLRELLETSHQSGIRPSC